MTVSDETKKVAELLGNERFAMLTTTGADGRTVSRPMALQEVEFDGDLWFFATRDSRKVEHIRTHDQVNVTVSSSDNWVSLTGRASISEDKARKEELWSAGVEAWLPDGPDSPQAVLLRVRAESAEYWDAPGGRVATLLSFVKAKAKGERLQAENERVEL